MTDMTPEKVRALLETARHIESPLAEPFSASNVLGEVPDLARAYLAACERIADLEAEMDRRSDPPADLVEAMREAVAFDGDLMAGMVTTTDVAEAAAAVAEAHAAARVAEERERAARTAESMASRAFSRRQVMRPSTIAAAIREGRGE